MEDNKCLVKKSTKLFLFFCFLDHAIKLMFQNSLFLFFVVCAYYLESFLEQM